MSAIIEFETDEVKEAKEVKECPVCYEQIASRNNCVTSCGHSFCLSCMLKCIQTNNCCPYCRTSLIEKKVEEVEEEEEEEHEVDVDEGDDMDDDDGQSLDYESESDMSEGFAEWLRDNREEQRIRRLLAADDAGGVVHAASPLPSAPTFDDAAMAIVDNGAVGSFTGIGISYNPEDTFTVTEGDMTGYTTATDPDNADYADDSDDADDSSVISALEYDSHEYFDVADGPIFSNNLLVFRHQYDSRSLYKGDD